MNQTNSTAFGKENAFPPLPLEEWKQTKNTLHLYLQIVWAGDDNVPAPAFYSYTAPEPKDLTDEKLKPEAAMWNTDKGAMAILMYDDARKANSPREAILDFLKSAYQAGAKRASWDTEKFKLKPI